MESLKPAEILNGLSVRIKKVGNKIIDFALDLMTVPHSNDSKYGPFHVAIDKETTKGIEDLTDDQTSLLDEIED